MKIFIYKVLFSFMCLFFLFQVTFGHQIRKTENMILNLGSKEKIFLIKEKLKEEMKKGIEKDKIVQDDDALIIKAFLKKIILELDLSEPN